MTMAHNPDNRIPLAKQTADLIKALTAAKIAMGAAWQSTKDGLEPLRPVVEKIGQDLKALLADAQAALRAQQTRQRAAAADKSADPP
jgi:LPS sulfotransferase NodH